MERTPSFILSRAAAGRRGHDPCELRARRAAGLGTMGSRRETKHRGYLVHSILLLESVSERTIGLMEQRHWSRDAVIYGKKHARKQRAYEDKESFKWEQASRRMAERLGETMKRTISVCDRESDIYEYLSYKLEQSHRFVLRAQADRCLLPSARRLFATMDRDAQTWCHDSVAVAQRGGRRARKVTVALRSLQVQLQPPADRRGADSLSVNVVLVQEVDPLPGKPALRWVLLTSEPVDSAEQVRRIVRYYELRWRIEEYHKAWKSGVGVERQRFQSAQNLERMLVHGVPGRASAAATRTPDATAGDDPGTACDTVLTLEEWHVLWLTGEQRARPDQAPSLHWACLAIARLGGFANTQRTGRPGWDALWKGWARLQERIQGYRLALQMAAQM